MAIGLKGDPAGGKGYIQVDTVDVVEITQQHIKVPSGTTAQRPATPSNGTLRYNTTTNAAEFYSNNRWVSVGVSDGSSEAAAASTAQNLYDLGIRSNGYYWLKLSGTTAKLIYCILDGSIEAGYGYMRIFDQRTANTGTEIQQFYSSATDYSNWTAIGGNSYVISQIAVSTYINQSSVVRYTNGGGGLHSSISPKTLTAVFAQGWSASGFESDNWKYFGAGTTNGTSPSTAQLFLNDDNDAGGASSTRQTAKAGTPQGLLMYPASSASSWSDAGNQYYGSGGMDGACVALYVR